MTSFIADVHLGKLARMLRLLGVDTLYSNAATPQQLIATAEEQHRMLLSRYAPFAQELPQQALTVGSTAPLEQLQQVLEHFHLKNTLQPFTRCLVCNGVLQVVTKDSILHQLEPATQQSFDAFWQCSDCQRIYWKGSHYERMLQLVEGIKPFSN